jgi:hypothetical protein
MSLTGTFLRNLVVRWQVTAFFVTLLLLLTVSPVQASERLLMSHAGMEAFMLTLDCRSKNEATLEIRSSTPDVFDGERVELQRLIGQVRAVVSIECPSIQRITAKGTVRRQLYFAGATEKAWGWRIIGLFAPLNEG